MLGILSDQSLPLSYLLDAINHAEVGHLPRAKQLTAVSDRGAQGPYQFLTKNLHDMGYGMPRNIPVSDITDYNKSRSLAGQYVTGYSEELGFKTPLEQLVAYTAGPQFAANWVARGANIEELGPRTQSYIKRAAAYLNDNYNQQQEPEMANTTFLGMPFDPQQAAVLSQMSDQGNPMATAAMEQILREQTNRQMMETPAGRSGVPYADGGSAVLTTPAAAAPVNDEFAAYRESDGSLRIPITEGTPTGRRDSTPLAARTPPPPPPPRPQTQPMMQPPRGNINDLLIAMGSAGLRGSAEGGLQGLASMGEAYGAYKAAEQDAIAKYNQSLAKAAGKSKSKGAPQQSPYTPVVLSAIDRIEGRVSEASDDWINPFDNVTGMTGSVMSIVPGSPAYDTAMDIETIVSSIGFDRLQAMRDASPTGGALGQVSERELSQLNASLGNLRQSQSRENFLVNLRAVRRHYQAAVEAIRAQQVEYARMNGLPVPPHPNTPGASMPTGAPTGTGNSNLSAADAIVGIN